MTPPTDPLLIPLIVTNIFHHLPFEERTRVRRLNKLWRDATLTSWRNTAVLVLECSCSYRKHCDRKDFNQLKENIRCNFHNMRRPTHIFNFHETPFLRYRLKYCGGGGLTLPPAFPREKFNPCDFLIRRCHVLKSLGQNITHLKINTCPVFPNELCIEQVKWLLLVACPNLKEFSIFLPKYSNYDSGIRNEVKLENLTATAKNLRALRIYDGPEPENVYSLSQSHRHHKNYNNLIGEQIFKLAPNIKELSLGGSSIVLVEALQHPLLLPEGNPHLKLQSLELDFRFRYTQDVKERDAFQNLRIYLLHISNPTLKQLNFVVRASKIRRNPFHFHYFLSECKSTLTKLEVTFIYGGKDNSSRWISDLCGIDLPNLTHLTLKSIEAQLDLLDLPVRLDFRCLRGKQRLKVFRCLSKRFFQRKYNDGMGLIPNQLTFNEKSPPWRNLNGNKSVQDERLILNPPDLKELEEFTFGLNEKLNEEALKLLAGWMPSLKKLAIVVDEQTFLDVFDIFPGLEEVTFLCGSSISAEMVIDKRSLLRNVKIDAIFLENECRKIYF